MTLTVVENISLDGVMQAPGRPDEDTRDGFAHGGWATSMFAADPEAAMAAMPGETPAAMLFGRRTYDDLLSYWLGSAGPNPFAEILRSTPKLVASRNPDAALGYPASTLLQGDLVASVLDAKRAVDGDIVVLGSGDVVRQLAASGVIDRYVLTVLPIVLGSGRRLFDDVYTGLDVESSTTSKTGIVTARYRVRRD